MAPLVRLVLDDVGCSYSLFGLVAVEIAVAVVVLAIEGVMSMAQTSRVATKLNPKL